MKRVLTLLLAIAICLSALAAVPTVSADTTYTPANAKCWSQKSDPWAWRSYNGYIYNSGCAILAATNAVNYLTGKLDTSAKANDFIDRWATYARQVGGFNDTWEAGSYGAVLFNTYEWSTGGYTRSATPLELKFGQEFGFEFESYYRARSVNNDLRNYLKDGCVAIANVPGHYICIADYDPSTDKFLVLDSYTYYTRGGEDVFWASAYQLSTGDLNVGDWGVIRSTGPTVTYPYQDGDDLMLYDGASTQVVSTDSTFPTTVSLVDGMNATGLKMQYTNPNSQASSTKIGGMAYVDMTQSADLSAYSHVTLDLYISDRITGSNGFQMNFCTSGGDGFNIMNTLDNFEAGWHKITVSFKENPDVSGATWSNINKLRITWFNYAERTNEVFFIVDNIRAHKGTVPKQTVYPYAIDSDNLMLYDGEDLASLAMNYGAKAYLTSGVTNNGFLMNCETPNAYADIKIGGTAHQALTGTTDLTAYPYVSLNVYLSRSFKDESAGFQVNFCTTTGDGYNQMFALDNLEAGWHTFWIAKADIAKAVDSADWSKINSIRYAFYNYSNNATPTNFVVDNVIATKTQPSDTPVNPPAPTYEYPYVVDDNTLMLYDGKTADPITTNFDTAVAVSDNALQMTYYNPNQYHDSTRVGGMATLALTKTADLSAYKTISFDLYVPQTMTGSNGFQTNFCTTGGDGYNIMNAIDDYEAGWHTITITMEGKVPATDVRWSEINNIRFTWYNYTGMTQPITFAIKNVKAYKGDPTPTTSYPKPIDANNINIFDGETSEPITTAFATEASVTGGVTGNALQLDFTDPDSQPTDPKVGGMAHLALNSADLSKYDTFSFLLYISRGFENESAGLQINFCTSGSDGYNQLEALDGLKSSDQAGGYYRIIIKRKDIPRIIDSADWTNINTIRFTFYNYSQNPTPTTFLIDDFVGYNETITPDPVVDEAVQAVENLIAELPAPEEVALTHEAQIAAARKAFDDLTDEQEAKVSKEASGKLVAVEEAFAKLPVEPPVETIPGDLNNDKVVDAKDALAALKHAVGKPTLSDDLVKIGDLNSDGLLDAKDALAMLKKAVEK